MNIIQGASKKVGLVTEIAVKSPQKSYFSTQLLGYQKLEFFEFFNLPGPWIIMFRYKFSKLKISNFLYPKMEVKKSDVFDVFIASKMSNFYLYFWVSNLKILYLNINIQRPGKVEKFEKFQFLIP